MDVPELVGAPTWAAMAVLLALVILEIVRKWRGSGRDEGSRESIHTRVAVLEERMESIQRELGRAGQDTLSVRRRVDDMHDRVLFLEAASRAASMRPGPAE